MFSECECAGKMSKKYCICRCVLSSCKCTKMHFGQGSALDTTGGA